jgi:molybdopterin-guanine dinucleotide biosynthesis protein A
MANASKLVVGIFVGGRGSRMGNVSKGLMAAPGSSTSLLERMSGELARAVPDAEIVLVGSAEPYAFLGLKSVPDAPENVGPLGGLLGLLQHAQERAAPWAVTLSCDLPRITTHIIARLASEHQAASALVTEQAGRRNPLIARYAVAEALPAARDVLNSGARSLQAVLDRLGSGVTTLALTAAEEASLVDWDTPEDVR